MDGNPEEYPTGRLSPGDHTRKLLRKDFDTRTRRQGIHTKLPTLPGVDSISIATRFLTGGRDQFIEIVQMAMLNNEPEAVKWWAVYADLPPYARTLVSFDDVCAASGVEPARLCGIMVSTAMRAGRDAANLVSALTHPKVLAAQIESATQINGPNPEISYRDRLTFLQAMGSAPLPKGGTVINVNASANAHAAAAAAADPSVPPFAMDVTPVRGHAALPAPDPTLAPIETTAVPESAHLAVSDDD